MRSGISGYAVWQRGKKSGMWSHEVLGPVLARLEEEKKKKEQVKEKKSDDFTKLQEQVIEIIDGCMSIEHLPTTKLVILTRYVFQATGTSNVTAVTQGKDSRVSMLSILMDKLGGARLLHLIENPPSISGESIPSHWPSFAPKSAKQAKVAEGSSSSDSPTYTSFATKFGELNCTLPEGYTVVDSPPWLPEACKFQSPTASLLVGQKIVLCWTDVAGKEQEWYVGTIDASLTDPKNVVEVIDGDLTGFWPVTFGVTFVDEEEEEEEMELRLDMDEYASSAQDGASSWCLLAPVKPARAAKAEAAEPKAVPKAEPEPAAAQPRSERARGKQPKVYTAAEKAAERARLMAALAELDED